jgi:hypothetical protein
MLCSCGQPAVTSPAVLRCYRCCASVYLQLRKQCVWLLLRVAGMMYRRLTLQVCCKPGKMHGGYGHKMLTPGRALGLQLPTVSGCPLMLSSLHHMSLQAPPSIVCICQHWLGFDWVCTTLMCLHAGGPVCVRVTGCAQGVLGSMLKTKNTLCLNVFSILICASASVGCIEALGVPPTLPACSD